MGSQVHLNFGSRKDQAGAKSRGCSVQVLKLRWCIKSGESRRKNKQTMVSVDTENHLEEVGLQVNTELR